jgi:hypothetical protein
MSTHLPDPVLTLIYRLEATLGKPMDFGDVAQGRRRIVPLTGGRFTGPSLNGTMTASGCHVKCACGTTASELSRQALVWGEGVGVHINRCSRGSLGSGRGAI